jgi:glucose-1-phosphate adenylyltransferase
LKGADYYDTPENILRDGIPIGIGEGCDLEGAIIDKNARLGPGVIIRPFPRGTEIDRQDYVIRDGIVVIPKSTTIPGGTVIAPE